MGCWQQHPLYFWKQNTPHQWELLTFVRGFLALEGMAGPGQGHQLVMVTGWQGLGTGSFSVLCSQLSPAVSNAIATHEGPPAGPPHLPWWCAVWGPVSPLLFPGTVEEWLHWFGIRTVLVPIVSCLLLLVLVILLVRMER